MSTAICFKSESSDYYMFLSKVSDIDTLKDELSKEWYVESEYLYEVASQSEEFDRGEIMAVLHDVVNKD